MSPSTKLLIFFVLSVPRSALSEIVGLYSNANCFVIDTYGVLGSTGFKTIELLERSVGKSFGMMSGESGQGIVMVHGEDNEITVSTSKLN